MLSDGAAIPADFLKAVLDGSSDGIVITDVNGTVVESSDSFCSCLGLSRADVLEANLSTCLARTSASASRRWVELEERVQSSASRGVCDLELLTNTGMRRFRVTATPLGQGGLVSFWHDETERVREKRDLRLTQFAVDRATDCILWMRPDGRLLYVNRSACQALGYSAGELLTMSIHDIDMEFSSERWSEQWEEIKRRRSYTVESLFRKRNGEVFPVDMSISYRMFGAEAFAYAVARDISRRREAEEALRVIQDRYAMATRAARTGVWDWDLRTGEFYVDPIMLEILGYEEQDEFPKSMQSWREHLHPADREAADEAAAACVSGTATEYLLEHRMLHKDASIRWILARGKVVRDAAGQPIRVVGTNTDITEQRVAEEELRRFRVIADHANYGMAVADLKGNLIYLNKNFANAHGYTVQELLGKNLSILHNDEQLEPAREIDAKLMAEGKYGPTQVWHTHKDGTPFPMLMNGIIVPDDQGEPTIMAVTAIDISDRVRADQALEARAHQQEVVAALGRQALAGGDLDSLLRETVESVTKTLEIPLCGIVELCTDGSEFLLREGVGWKAEDVGHAAFRADSKWQGSLALKESKTVLVEDAEEDQRFDQPTLLQEHGVVSSVAIPIRGWGRPFGMLIACDTRSRVFDRDDVNFLEGVANILAHALERRQAEEALATSQERLRNLAARLHAIREEERRVIAREIHDQLGQALTGMTMDLSWLVRRLPNEGNVRDRAASMQALLDDTVDSVRTISTQLRPPILDDLGLEAAVEWQATEFARQSGVNCELVLQMGDTFVQNEHATAAFRILQEALVNVARHARAENVRVEVRVESSKLYLTVSDDGCGIDAAALSSSFSIGLIGMRERAVALGGAVEIYRRSTGGTAVELELPLERGQGEDTE